MNKIEVSGNLKKGDRKYASGYFYQLDVARRSGTVDTLMVLSTDDRLMEGDVFITGHVRSEYIHGLGVPVFIVPEKVEAMQDGTDGFSETVITGTLKADPACHNTRTSKVISTVLVITDEGTVPVLLWGGTAKKAAETYKAGDRIQVAGRLQSRNYPDRKGNEHTTYELSANRIEPAPEG